MKHTHAIIIEDSSKVSFGGGQNISLQVSHILNNSKLDLTFVDFTSSSRYIDRIKKHFPNNDLIVFENDCPVNSSSFVRKIWELLTVNYFAKKNTTKLGQYITDTTIIYATTRRALMTAYYAHLRYGIPYVYHAHLVEDTRSLKYQIIKKALLKAQTIVCVSQTVFHSISDGVKVHLYNPAPETSAIKAINNDSAKVVATVGSLIHIKGIEYFLMAAKHLEHDSNIEFRVYGEGPLMAKLTSLAGTNVRFMGFCSDIIQELANKIDIFVQPTLIKEALPTTIIEAKVLGIPIITTNIGGQSEIIVNDLDGILVPIKDSVAISDAIQLLCSDVELYKSMSRQSKNSSTLFDREKFTQSITYLITH